MRAVGLVVIVPSMLLVLAALARASPREPHHGPLVAKASRER